MCKYCNSQNIIKKRDGYFVSGIDLESELRISLICGFMEYENKFCLIAEGDYDGRIYYYPKYCPECGRKL